MAARDRWIGWDDGTRGRNLQRIVNNSRFLILPWVQVKNLASTVLARGLRQMASDWPKHYGIEPWLVETLVDVNRHGEARETARRILRLAPATPSAARARAIVEKL